MTDRLLLDAMLGRLVTYLRMCGHDVVYTMEQEIEDDSEIRDLAVNENRVLVTRDRTLARSVDGAILLESRYIDGQLREVNAAGIDLSLDEPSRCSECNGELQRVSEDASTPEYTPDPDTEPIWCCRSCGQIYWKGSHWDDVAARITDSYPTG